MKDLLVFVCEIEEIELNKESVTSQASRAEHVAMGSGPLAYCNTADPTSLVCLVATRSPEFATPHHANDRRGRVRAHRSLGDYGT